MLFLGKSPFAFENLNSLDMDLKFLALLRRFLGKYLFEYLNWVSSTKPRKIEILLNIDKKHIYLQKKGAVYFCPFIYIDDNCSALFPTFRKILQKNLSGAAAVPSLWDLHDGASCGLYRSNVAGSGSLSRPFCCPRGSEAEASAFFVSGEVDEI